MPRKDTTTSPGAARKPTRLDLLRVIAELQDLIGRAKSSYHDDRQHCRADTVVGPLERGFDLAVRASSFDPPVSGRWPRVAGLTTRQHEILYHSLPDDYWVTPMLVGGTDQSHHSATLAQLFRKGFAERRLRGGHTRSAWEYRRTPAGKRAVNE